MSRKHTGAAAGLRCVDLFAGAGGFSEGARLAGARVVWAANHWPLAVAAHEANHPGTVHECQDLRQADWSRLPAYDLLLAAPACQGHSQASQPKRRAYHDRLRSTAWAVVDCADATEPAAIVVENVPDFLRWRLYPAWSDALAALGYRLTCQTIRATACGVPQRRDRLFIVATRGAEIAIDLPAPRREPAIGPCIEWGAGRWRPISTVARRYPTAHGRLVRARARWGARCLVQHVTGHTGIPLTDPIRTVTTCDQWQVIRGKLYRPLTIRETARAMGFRDSYRLPADATRRQSIRLLGNAVCPPVGAAIVARVAEAL